MEHAIWLQEKVKSVQFQQLPNSFLTYMKSNNKSNWLQYSGVGIQMVLTMLICWWLGLKLDDYFGFENPWFTIGGLFFGMFAGMYNLIKSVK